MRSFRNAGIGLAVVALSACASASYSEDERGAGADAGAIGRPDAGDLRPFSDAAPVEDAAPAEADAAPVEPDASPVCPPGLKESLVNGGFDLGQSPDWVETSGAPQPFPLIVTTAEMPADLPPQAGSHAVWMGGYLAAGLVATDLLEQTVTVPADTTTLVFSGQRMTATEETFGAFDFLYLEITDAGGTVLETLATFSNENSLDWTAFSLTATGNYAGQTIRVRFRATVDDLYNTNFFIDSLSLKLDGCPEL